MKQTKNKTLLEQIIATPKAIGGRPRKTVLDAETAIAWLKGEIPLVSISRVIWPGKNPGSTTTMVYLFLNMSLREAYRHGKIKIVE